MKERDRYWNILYSEEIKSWTSYKLQIKGREFPISLWTMKKWVLFVRRRTDEHRFYATNSYWFNVSLLNSLPKETRIIVFELENWLRRPINLETRVGDILEYKDYKTFLTQGFESQIFYPISKFKKITKRERFLESKQVEEYNKPEDKYINPLLTNASLSWETES